MLLVLTAVVLGAGILFAWSSVLFPVWAAFLLAYLTHPLASFFERHRLPRFLGFLCMLVLLLGFSLLIFAVFLPAIIHELIASSQKFPSWREALGKYIGSSLLSLEERYPDAYALIHEHITQWAQENVPSIAQRLLQWLLGILGSAVGWAAALLNLILIPVIAAYLTVDFRKFLNRIRALIPQPVLPTVENIVRDVHQVLSDFLWGQLLVAVALGVMYTAGLLITQAPLAVVIGPLAGVLALVPYLGFVVGFGVAALLTSLEYQDLWHLAGVGATFVVAQTIEGWVLTPNLLGKKVGLHPVWVLVALLLGGEFFGLPGIVVAVPVAAVIRVVLQHGIQAYQESQLYTGTGKSLLLYTRKNCPLCDAFEQKIQSLLKRHAFDFCRVDVENSPVLVERFGARVPVLEINGKVVAEGRATSEELEQILLNWEKNFS
jgi:predicted PurR-regulated permease PerM